MCCNFFKNELNEKSFKKYFVHIKNQKICKQKTIFFKTVDQNLPFIYILRNEKILIENQIQLSNPFEDIYTLPLDVLTHCTSTGF